jgi:hypothetical protein
MGVENHLKVFFVLLVAVFIFSGCNNPNWQPVVSAESGFDIVLPNDWSYKKCERISRGVKLYVKTKSPNFNGAADELHQYLFELSKRKYPYSDWGGIACVKCTNTGKEVYELTGNSGNLTPTSWYYKGCNWFGKKLNQCGSMLMMVNISFSEKNKTAEITFSY